MQAIELPLALVTVAAVLAAPAAANERSGFLADVQLGAGTANFTLESGSDDGDTGVMFAFDLGYGWSSGWALTGGLSATAFAYELKGIGGSDLADYTLTFTIFEISGWYFHPVSSHVELFVRLGAGPSTGNAELKSGSTKVSTEESSTGVVFSGGANFFFSEDGDFALAAELFHRRYGVTFKEGELKDEELASTGLALVARWR